MVAFVRNLRTVNLSCLKHSVWDFLFRLISVEISCLRQTNPTPNYLYFFLIVVAGFFFFFQFLWLMAVICFAVLTLTRHFCKSSNTYGSSTHSKNIWHVDKTEVVTVPFEKKKHILNDFFNLLYLKLWCENIF